MTNDRALVGLDITNFRSIRGHVYVPLDGQVVLIHGENGAGKTSLLSAIEYGLTGSVQALHRADPDYTNHLLHRTATHGSVEVTTTHDGREEKFTAQIDTKGAHSVSRLGVKDAAFFTERAYLPQSLLSQLLQIYQESGSKSTSPLATFVDDLLGLDRLDALETGLRPFHDLRNLRKEVSQWSLVEDERDRSNRSASGRRAGLESMTASIKVILNELQGISDSLGLDITVDEASLPTLASTFNKDSDERIYEDVLDRQRRLASIVREISSALRLTDPTVSDLQSEASAASKAYEEWEQANRDALGKLQSQITTLVPAISAPRDIFAIVDETLPPLESERLQILERAQLGREDLKRVVDLGNELEATRERFRIITDEIGQIASDSEVLASALGELASHIKTNICPVCDRDFAELAAGSLADHVHWKVSELSSSAERLLTLGKVRGQCQLRVTDLEAELRVIESRDATTQTVSDLDRRASSIASVIADVRRLAPLLARGLVLRESEIAARRRATEFKSSNAALMAARETLSHFAYSIGAAPLGTIEGVEAVSERLGAILADEADRLNKRLTWRRHGVEKLASIGPMLQRRSDTLNAIRHETSLAEQAVQVLDRAQRLREQVLTIRDTVDGVRSAIIRSVFNHQLNRVWRDLFIRLAPSEPFVPAFRIPGGETKGIQPKLITTHRDTGEPAGTPGAMLSAGNLNTAALTLFIALHLSVPKALPWLILDDPVQSMDDVHIAHFATLLRTLAKEKDRQIILAVHDRQLFEYLKLELSPAFPDDSLVTLELHRGPNRDTACIPDRPLFLEERELLETA